MADEERREHERLEYTATVSLQYEEAQAASLPVRNISAGGIYLALGLAQRAGVEVGDNVSVYFDAGPDDDGNPIDIHMEAEVVRIDHRTLEQDAGIALMWTSIDPEMVRRLAELLDHLQR